LASAREGGNFPASKKGPENFLPGASCRHTWCILSGKNTFLGKNEPAKANEFKNLRRFASRRTWENTAQKKRGDRLAGTQMDDNFRVTGWRLHKRVTASQVKKIRSRFFLPGASHWQTGCFFQGKKSDVWQEWTRKHVGHFWKMKTKISGAKRWT
jgi:hypothetical protein